MEDEVVFFLFFFCQRGRALCEKYCDVNCCQHVLPSPSSHCCRLVPVGHIAQHIQLSTAHVWIPLTLCSVYLSILFESCILNTFCKTGLSFHVDCGINRSFYNSNKNVYILFTYESYVLYFHRWIEASLFSPHIFAMFVSLFSQFSAARRHLSMSLTEIKVRITIIS